MPEHPRVARPCSAVRREGWVLCPGVLSGMMRGSVSRWPARDLLSPGTAAKESFTFSWVPRLQGGSPSRSCARTGGLVGAGAVPAGVRLPGRCGEPVHAD